MRAYFRAAIRASSSLFAPVTTILPLRKMSAVVFGSRIRMMTAAKRFGLYSALRAFRAIVFRSSSVARLHVATMFCRMGLMPDGLSAGVHAAETAVEVDGSSSPSYDGPAPAEDGPASSAIRTYERAARLLVSVPQRTHAALGG